MKTNILIAVALVFGSVSHVIADQKQDLDVSCNTLYDASNPPVVSFLGDSLGDFVDQDFYGVFGWGAYLGHAQPARTWNVQNLAIAGRRTVGVFNNLVKCVKVENKGLFQLSNHVAFEIGGNDAADVIIPLAMFPWKMFTIDVPGYHNVGVVDQLKHNVRAIVRLLRHPRLDKDVLVMGNFPTPSGSPSLGNVGDYMTYMRNTQDQIYLTEKGSSLDRLGKSLSDWGKQQGAQIGGVISPPQNDVGPNGWYLQWRKSVDANPTEVISVVLFLMQNELQTVVAEENAYTKNYIKLDGDGNEIPNRRGGTYISFVSMYEYFIHWPDCLGWGKCWVASPYIQRDAIPGHINVWGYMLWASRLAPKIEELGWHDDLTPRNNGFVNYPEAVPVDIEPEIPATPINADPQPIDWLLLVCLFTGRCW